MVGGLSPELLRRIPSGSLVGLTPNAVISIPDNNFQAFKIQQLRKYTGFQPVLRKCFKKIRIFVSFPLAAAQTATKKRSELVAEMNDALNYAIYGDSLGNSSRRNIGSKCILSLCSTLEFLTFLKKIQFHFYRLCTFSHDNRPTYTTDLLVIIISQLYG